MPGRKASGCVAPLNVADARSPEESSAAEAALSESEGRVEDTAVADASEEAPAAAERVDLRSGGMVTGTIVEILPGESLTIVNEADERRSFPWAEVARYTQDGAWVVVEEAAPERPRRRSGYGPRLHIETARPGPVSLYEITSEAVASGGNVILHSINYRAVCSAPCDDEVDVSAGRPFFFGGPGLTPSRRFALSSGGSVNARVRPGRKWVWTTGMIALTLGATGAVGGGAWMGLRKNAAENPGRDEFGDPLPPQEPDLVAPTALLVSGVALLVGGVAMMIVGRTRYKLSGG